MERLRVQNTSNYPQNLQEKNVASQETDRCGQWSCVYYCTLTPLLVHCCYTSEFTILFPWVQSKGANSVPACSGLSDMRCVPTQLYLPSKMNGLCSDGAEFLPQIQNGVLVRQRPLQKVTEKQRNQKRFPRETFGGKTFKAAFHMKETEGSWVSKRLLSRGGKALRAALLQIRLVDPAQCRGQHS